MDNPTSLTPHQHPLVGTEE